LAGVYGRFIDQTTVLYDNPSFDSKPIKKYFMDAVIPITDVTLGGENPSYNRIWYRLENLGYAHSGVIQPVRILLNPTGIEIPPGGCVGEVTVPFTDAHWWPNAERAVACRLYYATAHWVSKATTDDTGKTWYRVYDDKLRASYNIQAAHLRLVPTNELAPISPDVLPDEKRLEVHLANQVVVAYERDRAVFMAKIASGAKFRNGDYTTPGGWHRIMYKKPSRHMAAGDRAAANSYDLPGIPWVSYFTEDGVAFHGTFWHNDFGKPRSHGCITLTPQAARWIYLWTNPVVPVDEDNIFEDNGTLVNVI
jgi:lipoprotein-anchoring transpeptidase ErfK/SrfK